MQRNSVVNQPIFVDGKVQFDDGTPMNSSVRIERVCSGSPRLEEHADAKGSFYFQLNRTVELDIDASSDSSVLSGTGTRDHTAISSASGSDLNNIACEIRAAYPGYRSDTYNIRMRPAGEGIHVGTLLLHKLGGVSGTTMSITTALAPRHAQKDYDRGMQLLGNGKYPEAERQFQQAATRYPNYAIAWFALGELQRKDGRDDDAKRSYEAAMKADGHYVSPYLAMAQLAGQKKNWQEALEYSKQTISLNSVEFPSAYWYNGVANFQLSKWVDAEKSLTELLRLDTAHRFTGAEDLMGRILLQRGDLAGAAVHLRTYLTLNPHATDSDVVKRALDKIALAKPSEPASKESEPVVPKE